MCKILSFPFLFQTYETYMNTAASKMRQKMKMYGKHVTLAINHNEITSIFEKTLTEEKKRYLLHRRFCDAISDIPMYYEKRISLYSFFKSPNININDYIKVIKMVIRFWIGFVATMIQKESEAHVHRLLGSRTTIREFC